MPPTQPWASRRTADVGGKCSVTWHFRRSCRVLCHDRFDGCHRALTRQARARGKRLGRQPGQRPKSDRLAPKVLALVAAKRSYRLIGRELGLSKNTVASIVTRQRRPAGDLP